MSTPFKAYLSKKPAELKSAPRTLFLHGFLGSHKNFKSLARHVHGTLHHSTYAIDLPNHGAAPHIFPMTYDMLTDYIHGFIMEHGLGNFKVNIVGYSMGAKVAMNLALKNPSMVDKLVCIDNAPVVKDVGQEFKKHVKILPEVQKWCNENFKGSNPIWQKKALEYLMQKDIPSANFAMYLLDNLKYDTSVEKIVSKQPIEKFDERVLKDLGLFPTHNDPIQTDTLFIKASRSGFIDSHGIKEINHLFPNHTLKEINDTHDGVYINHCKEVETLIIEHLKSHN